MILHIQKEIPLYQKLGVFTEAPKKSARKIRTVSATTPRSLSDYTADVEPEEELNLDDLEMDGLEDGDVEDLTTGADDEELETDDPADGDDGATTDATQTDDGDETPDEPATDDEEGGGGDEPATDDGGGDDLTSGADDDTGDDAGNTGGDGGDVEGEGKGKAFKKDDMRKFILFKNFIDLHTSLENYISKLNTSDTNNNILASAYREARVKFQEIESMLYDYMVLKFSADSYTSAFYFYEQTRALVLILFSLLEEAKEKAKQDQEKSTSRSKT